MEKESKSNGTKTDGVQKYSYEELNKICGELSAQNQRLYAHIQKLNAEINELHQAFQVKRLDYLFKVVELSNSSRDVTCFNTDFVNSCIDEIEESLSVSEDDESKDIPDVNSK